MLEAEIIEDDDFEADFHNIFNMNLQQFPQKFNEMMIGALDLGHDGDPVIAEIAKADDAALIRPFFQCVACFERMYIDDGCVACSSVSAIPPRALSTSHSLCITCIRNYAHSAITEIPVAHGGLGLQCASNGCKNVILLCKFFSPLYPQKPEEILADFEFYLGDEDYLPLKLRLQEQCLADAGLNDLVTWVFDKQVIFMNSLITDVQNAD